MDLLAAVVLLIVVLLVSAFARPPYQLKRMLRKLRRR